MNNVSRTLRIPQIYGNTFLSGVDDSRRYSRHRSVSYHYGPP